VTPPAGPNGLSHQVSYGYDSNGERTSVTTNVDASTTRTSYTDYNRLVAEYKKSKGL